jgi:hypothetical protein
MLIVLLALSGVLIFLVWDYMKYKDVTNANLATANTNLQNEKTDRLSNMKYIVDQVNTVNTDIFNTFSSNQQLASTRMDGIQGKQDKMISGLGHFLRFTSNVSINPSSTASAISGAVSLTDLPGFVSPDVQLIKHVTAVSGLTIKDISSSSNSVMFCSLADPNRCIKFPDGDGNTYLTTMTNNSKIVMDAESDIMNKLNFKSSSDKLQYASISAFDNLGQRDMQVNANNTIRLMPGSGKVGISTSMANINAALHVVSNGTGDVFLAESPSATNKVSVDNNGNLRVNRIQMGTSGAVVIEATSGNAVTITAPGGITVNTGASTSTTFNNQVILGQGSQIRNSAGTLVGIGTAA